MCPLPAAPAWMHPQIPSLGGTADPLGAVWGVCLSLCVHGDVCRVQEAGCEGAGRGTASSSWLPLRLALLAAVPKLPSLPLRCLLCCSPKAPGPGDLSRLPQLGFGSSNFRHFTVLLSRCSAEEQCLCREASLAFPHCCWLCLCLAPSCCRLQGDSARYTRTPFRDGAHAWVQHEDGTGGLPRAFAAPWRCSSACGMKPHHRVLYRDGVGWGVGRRKPRHRLQTGRGCSLTTATQPQETQKLNVT